MLHRVINGFSSWQKIAFLLMKIALFDIGPTRKMTVFGAIFGVNSSIGKLWDLLGYFGEEDKIFINNIHF